MLWSQPDSFYILFKPQDYVALRSFSTHRASRALESITAAFFRLPTPTGKKDSSIFGKYSARRARHVCARVLFALCKLVSMGHFRS